MRMECSDFFLSATGSAVLMAEKCPVVRVWTSLVKHRLTKNPGRRSRVVLSYELHEKQTVEVVLSCNLFVQIRAGSSVVNRRRKLSRMRIEILL
jgi:hypothetical protein